METRNYECHYCKKEYVPKRRGVQKFCSNSCRVRSHQLKSKPTVKPTEATTLSIVANKNRKEFQKTKIDQISLSGVSNAAIGSGVVELAKEIFTTKENKPATKKDIQQLELRLSEVIKEMAGREKNLKVFFKPC
ncbi:hypothetical protein [Polaribacter sp. MED152]|uniref:hypothetical protein n=1 Tax=Polaribacter sp. MED152 TaxID=313598 RepID=UPI000068CBE8|nr:hypothetical protein [Polaribacter sp. MED152]EAQ42526.1 hypothetical protein MED152_07390 [Polaribacter sp. MED152]